jgi:hypothetical protein
MRIWDLPVENLCRDHLLGEHRELHALWVILTEDRPAYRRHPETRRWEGRLLALHARHERQAAELARRGWRHHSPIDPAPAQGSAAVQSELVDPISIQVARLRAKGCGCRLDGPMSTAQVGPGEAADVAAED